MNDERFFFFFYADFNLDISTHLGIECCKELDVRMELFCSISKSLKI